METRGNTASLFLLVGQIIKVRMKHELPLGFTQCETLRLLKEKQPLAMRAIASHFNITAPSATAIIGDLVVAGYVDRTENKEDRREVILGLTAQGEKTLAEVEKKRAKVIAAVLSVLTESDRKELDRILGKILSHHS